MKVKEYLKIKEIREAVILAIICIALAVCLNVNAQSVVREGNTFSSVSSKSVTQEKKTKFTWKDSKGTEYPIYISKTGSCYVKKVSKKTGKEYKQYLGKEVSAQVCKELGIEYTPRK